MSVVKYHNDFNKISLGRFNEIEQNLLFGILVKCKNKQDIEMEFSLNDLISLVGNRSNLTNDEIRKMAMNLADNFIKLDFRAIKEIEQGQTIHGFFNLFSHILVYVDKNDNLDKISLKVNPDFAYLINEFAKEFTQFELEEFIFLKGRYVKTLYRHLKQFRTTGVWRVSLEHFRDILCIPNTYKMCDIDKQILKPCIAQLSEELNIFELFDNSHNKTTRTPFKNLKYTKIKGFGRGRGGSITHIEFTFDKQKSINSKNTDKKMVLKSDKLEPYFIEKLKECANCRGLVIYKDCSLYLHTISVDDEFVTLSLSNHKHFFKGSALTLTFKQAEQFAKSNNLI